MNMNVTTASIPKPKRIDEEARSLKECKEGVSLWNKTRWNTNEVIRHLNEGWVFRISPEIYKYIDIKSKDSGSLRGYIAVLDNSLHLVILNSILDQRIFDGTVTDATLYAAPYVRVGLNMNNLIKGEGDLFAKMRRWAKSYEEYVTTVIKRYKPKKSDSNGLVKLFEIATKDIVNEFSGDCAFVYCIPGIKPGNKENGIDLIFIGVDPKIKVKRRQVIMPDDFTTPRPPFGSESGYGLL
jgi:hypothetical protein